MRFSIYFYTYTRIDLNRSFFAFFIYLEVINIYYPITDPTVTIEFYTTFRDPTLEKLSTVYTFSMGIVVAAGLKPGYCILIEFIFTRYISCVGIRSVRIPMYKFYG